MDTLLQEEYKAKWQYVMHTESLQAKYIQWYFGVVAAVLTFIYSGKYEIAETHIGGVWVPLMVVSIYSILVNLRLVVQKRNYETYTNRIREIEGNKENGSSIKKKLLSVFKLQYYAVVLVGSVVAVALSLEFGFEKNVSIIIGIAYGLIMAGLSFSSLIEK